MDAMTTQATLHLESLRTRGLTRGFEDGRRYATGDKQVRASIRARVAKVKAAGGEWAGGYLEGLEDQVEQRAKAIRMGIVARTIRPSKLWALVNRD